MESGQVNEDGRFEALPLNVTGHEVYAVLLVNDPDDDLLEGIFYLEASNAYGKQTYEFSFEKYILDWDPEPEDVDPETPGDEIEGGEGTYPESSSMGAGTIVGKFISQCRYITHCSLHVFNLDQKVQSQNLFSYLLR